MASLGNATRATTDGRLAVTAQEVRESLRDRDGRGRWYPSAGPILVLLALALFMTVLNVAKPYCHDDAIYYLFAEHTAQDPLNPYGFRLWDVTDANAVLAPPVFLYWWALGIRVFGDDPVAWRLWLLPIALVFVAALYTLGRRFARGMELWLVALVSLAPAFLPGLNMMLDIPALALALLALCLFFRACDRGSIGWALAAGIVAGLAMQAKYTAFVAPAVMVVYALLFGRWRLGILTATLAASIFVGWELWVASLNGSSHFANALLHGHGTLPFLSKYKLIQSLIGNVGSTALGILLLGLAALRGSTRLIVTVTVLSILGLALVVFVPDAAMVAVQQALRLDQPMKVSSLVFGIQGVLVLGIGGAVAGRLLRRAPTVDEGPRPCGRFSVDTFLVGWLVLELAGSLALSPMPAVRRIMGLEVVLALLACRLAARTCRHRPGLLWGIASVNAVLGLALFAADYESYRPQHELAQELSDDCRGQAADAAIWMYGTEGFNYYGNRLGMETMMAPDAPVKTGDWVIVFDRFREYFPGHPVAGRCELVEVRERYPLLPVFTTMDVGGVALTHHEAPSFRLMLYRVQ